METLAHIGGWIMVALCGLSIVFGVASVIVYALLRLSLRSSLQTVSEETKEN